VKRNHTLGKQIIPLKNIMESFQYSLHCLKQKVQFFNEPLTHVTCWSYLS